MSGIERRPSQANPKLSEVLMSSGTVLFKEGDRADAMYIVQQGEIEISIQQGEHALATLEKGASFGEQAVVGRSTGWPLQLQRPMRFVLKFPPTGWADRLVARRLC